MVSTSPMGGCDAAVHLALAKHGDQITAEGSGLMRMKMQHVNCHELGLERRG